MVFKYKVTEEVNNLGSSITKTYEGFTNTITRRNLKGNTLVIAWCDGEPEYWIVNTTTQTGIESLHEFYNDMEGEIPVFTFLEECP